jgi:hypothetical protein
MAAAALVMAPVVPSCPIDSVLSNPDLLCAVLKSVPASGKACCCTVSKLWHREAAPLAALDGSWQSEYLRRFWSRRQALLWG